MNGRREIHVLRRLLCTVPSRNELEPPHVGSLRQEEGYAGCYGKKKNVPIKRLLAAPEWRAGPEIPGPHSGLAGADRA